MITTQNSISFNSIIFIKCIKRLSIMLFVLIKLYLCVLNEI